MSRNIFLTLLLLLLCVITTRLNLAEASIGKCDLPEERPNIRWNPYMNGCENITCNFTSKCENYLYSKQSCDTINSPTNRYYCLCDANATKTSTKPYVCESSGMSIGYAFDESSSQSYCSNNNIDYNQICINGECKCAPKFSGSDRLEICFSKMCDNNSDCQLNHPNRICDRLNTNQCVCGRNYHEDSTNMKCIKKTTCTSLSKCDTNEFCIDNQCECQPNYRYNSVSKSCEYHSCTHTSDCSLYDPYQVCLSSGVCDCMSGYEKHWLYKFCAQHEYPTTTVIPTIPYYYCYTPSGCYSNQICIKYKCECIPGYEYSKNGSCEYKSCYNNFECQIYDSNRECVSGACICMSGYSENTQTKFCNKSLNKDCSNNYDCQTTDNQVCFDGQCQCAPNYKWNDYYSTCDAYSCHTDYSCQTYDSNRECNSSTCSCKSGYSENTTSKFCYKSLNKDCSNNSDCQTTDNQVCVDGQCQCAPNYQWNDYYSTCDAYSCHTDSSCQEYDHNRYCAHLKCMCSSDYTEDPDNFKCIHSPTSTSETISTT